MIRQRTTNPASLYLEDETAWLEATAELLRQKRFDEVDHENLCEYLSDMARRDRREVKSRLTVLLTHLLKWDHQPDQRSGSWQATIITQRQDLTDLCAQGVLRNHAQEILADAYRDAIARARAETGLPDGVFPHDCPYTLDAALLGEAS